MNQYVTGSIIKRLREERKLTQQQLAEQLLVSDKTISKWENGRGYPDITLLEPLAAALGISLPELLSGQTVINTNRHGNMNKMKFYVCPVCGNILTGTGEAVISCCGITLPPQEAEEADGRHDLQVTLCEDEYYITSGHEMDKTHYLSFLAAVRDNGFELVKLYPEMDAEVRFQVARTDRIYYYCNRHGLFFKKVSPMRMGRNPNL